MADFKDLKAELKWLAAGYVVLCIVIFIAFSKSSILEIIRTGAALYWMFIIPGYALALCSSQPFSSRIAIGIPVQAAVFSLASYYAGLAGWHVATHGLVLPIASIIIGLVLWRKSLLDSKAQKD